MLVVESGSWKAEAALGTVVLAVIAAFVWLTFEAGGRAPAGAHRFVLMLDSALGLSPDNTVAVAGVKVGVVEDIAVEGRRARVTVALEPSLALRADARAALRQKTLLGEKYIDLDPGAAAGPPLPPGSVLEDNLPTVELDKLLRDVSRLVDRMNSVAPAVESAVARVDTLLEGEGGARLQAQFADTLSDMRALVNAANELVQGSSDDLAAVLAVMRERGPLLADRLESTGARLEAVLGGVDTRALSEAAGQVGPAAIRIASVGDDVRAALGDLRGVAQRLDGVLAHFDKSLLKLDAVDEQDVREFLQLEGVRVNLIPDPAMVRRIKRMRGQDPESVRASEPDAPEAGASADKATDQTSTGVQGQSQPKSR